MIRNLVEVPNTKKQRKYRIVGKVRTKEDKANILVKKTGKKEPNIIIEDEEYKSN